MAKRKQVNRVVEFDNALRDHAYLVRRYWEFVHNTNWAKAAMAGLRRGEVDDDVLAAESQAKQAFDKRIGMQLIRVQESHRKLVLLFTRSIKGKPKCTTTTTRKRSQRSR